MTAAATPISSRATPPCNGAPAWSDLEVLVRRVLAIAAFCVGGALLAALVVLAAGAPLHGGVGLELIGVAAAVTVIAVVAAVARLPAREG